MSEPITLSDETIEAIANRVADLLEHRLAPAFKQPPELIDAAEVARRLDVSRDWVYQHADRLGAHRIGNGPRGRLRFDPERIAEALRPEPVPPAAPRPQRRRPPRRKPDVELLPIRGR